jgi:antitoxin FitA
MAHVQVRNVEAEVHDELRRRAAEAGLTLSEYVLQLIRRDLRRPSRAAWLADLSQLQPTGRTSDEVLTMLDESRGERTAPA